MGRDARGTPQRASHPVMLTGFQPMRARRTAGPKTALRANEAPGHPRGAQHIALDRPQKSITQPAALPGAERPTPVATKRGRAPDPAGRSPQQAVAVIRRLVCSVCSAPPGGPPARAVPDSRLSTAGRLRCVGGSDGLALQRPAQARPVSHADPFSSLAIGHPPQRTFLGATLEDSFFRPMRLWVIRPNQRKFVLGVS